MNRPTQTCLTTKLVGLSKLASTCGTKTRVKVVIGEPSSQLKGPQHGCQTVLKKNLNTCSGTGTRITESGFVEFWISSIYPMCMATIATPYEQDIPIHTSSDSCCRDNSACWRVRRVRASWMWQQESRNCHKIDNIKIQARSCHHFAYCYLYVECSHSMSQRQVNQRMLTTSACREIEKHAVILQIFGALKFRKRAIAASF